MTRDEAGGFAPSPMDLNQWRIIGASREYLGQHDEQECANSRAAGKAGQTEPKRIGVGWSSLDTLCGAGAGIRCFRERW
jgi:hypothetical protein